MADDRTLGEALRLLDQVSRRLERLAEDMVRDRERWGQTYVQRELYLTQRDEHSRRLIRLEEENEERDKAAAETRRQLLFIVLGAFVTALFALLVALYVGSGGSP